MKIITTILVVLITTAAVGQKCLPPQLGQSYCASFATLISVIARYLVSCMCR
jgi:hypothetical protein